MNDQMPVMPPPPRPALVLNLSLPMAKGGKIIPQPLWMESQLKDYAQQYALQFERAAASLALERAELAAEVDRLRNVLAEHNAECRELCAGRKASGTLCDAYSIRGRKCPDCPMDNILGA